MSNRWWHHRRFSNKMLYSQIFFHNMCSAHLHFLWLQPIPLSNLHHTFGGDIIAASVAIFIRRRPFYTHAAQCHVSFVQKVVWPACTVQSLMPDQEPYRFLDIDLTVTEQTMSSFTASYPFIHDTTICRFLTEPMHRLANKHRMYFFISHCALDSILFGFSMEPSSVNTSNPDINPLPWNVMRIFESQWDIFQSLQTSLTSL